MFLQAGLIRDVKSENLRLALEPEAAALYCQAVQTAGFRGQKTNNQQEAGLFDVGTQYLIVDAGGVYLFYFIIYIRLQSPITKNKIKKNTKIFEQDALSREKYLKAAAASFVFLITPFCAPTISLLSKLNYVT